MADLLYVSLIYMVFFWEILKSATEPQNETFATKFHVIAQNLATQVISIYLFKVNKLNTRKSCEICS